MCGKIPPMSYHHIDLDTWSRRPHFDLFDAMAHPWLDICCTIDATTAWAFCNAEGGPSFSTASLFLAIGAVNSVEQLRMRIRGDKNESDRVRIQKNELIDRDIDDVIHFSVVPWLNFTGIGHPRDRNLLYSVPKIVIGKCIEQGSRWSLPVALSAHHGLVDGLHAARFFDHLQRRCDQAETLLSS